MIYEGALISSHKFLFVDAMASSNVQNLASKTTYLEDCHASFINAFRYLKRISALSFCSNNIRERGGTNLRTVRE